MKPCSVFNQWLVLRLSAALIASPIALAAGACNKGGPPPEAVLNPDRCGWTPPEFDPATHAIATNWHQDPPIDTVPPFVACQTALQELSTSRPSCEQVTGRRTLLVTKQGEQDPRWLTSLYDAHFDTITAAIDAANHCDTVIVRPGTYREYLRIEGKDVQVSSDTWNEDGTAEDGDERAEDYVAERIDLHHYYHTGERVVVETRQPYLRPLKRAVRTILEGGGYDDGPDLGGALTPDEHDPEDPNRGCGNRRPMVDFVAGTTRNTVFDGFSVRLMPEQNHTIPGHGHTLQARGGSPIIRHNIIYQNGSTGVGVHASWQKTTPVTPPCELDPSLEQETFSNDDYRHSNVQYRPVPLIYDNISYQNNGLRLGNNHYSCAAMIANESFWNAVPGEQDSHQSPGIGTRHGAKTYLEYNVVYENAWTGIGVRQGYLQPKEACAEDPQNCNHIDERTQAVVKNNIVFNNGFGDTPADSQGGIALDGVGLPDEPVLVQGNVVYLSKVSGIGVRNEYAGENRGFVMDDSYVQIVGNTVFGNALLGITCKGSAYGTSNCTVVGNDSYWNNGCGIGFTDGAAGYALNNVAACNLNSGIITFNSAVIPMLNNVAYFNVQAGIVDPNGAHDYNIFMGNRGWENSCDSGQAGTSCRNSQLAVQNDGTGPGANDLFVDPLFSNPLAYDFTLQSASPAIDSGTDIAQYFDWPTSGNGPDRGSHER